MKKRDFDKLSALESFKLILSDEAPFGNPVCTNPSCTSYLKYSPEKIKKSGTYDIKATGKSKQQYKCLLCGTKFFQHSFGFEDDSNFYDQELFEDLRQSWAMYIPRHKIAEDLGRVCTQRKGQRISEKTMRKFLRLTEVHYRHQLRSSFFINEVDKIRLLEVPFKISSKRKASIFLFFRDDLRIINFAVIPDKFPKKARFLKMLVKTFKKMPFNQMRDENCLFISSPNTYPMAQKAAINPEDHFKKLYFPNKWLTQVKSTGILKAKLSLFVLVYNNFLRDQAKKAPKKSAS